MALAVLQGVDVATQIVDDELEVLGVNNKVQLAQLERHYQGRLALQLLESGVDELQISFVIGASCFPVRLLADC